MAAHDYRLAYKTGKKSDLVVTLTSSNNRVYSFILKKHRIQVDPHEGWMEAIPQEARIMAFDAMLAEFRKRSRVGHGIKSAAIGVTEHGEVFIAANTENRGDNDFPRDCAEQNMVNLFRQDIRIDGQQKLREIYIMGGRDDVEPSIICPCGNCTDTLAREMVNATAPVVVLPVRTQSRPVILNTQAKKIFEIARGEAWQTTIGNLDAHRYIPLNAEGKRFTEIGGDELVAHMPHGPDTPVISELRAHMTNHDAVHSRPVKSLEATMASGSISDIARYAQHRMYSALSNRMRSDAVFSGLATLTERKDYVAEKVKSVQVAIVKLADGAFHESIVVNSSYDRASPPAVTLAVLNNQLSHQPVTDVWFMEYNPTKAAQGMMLSPSKESIERSVKRGNNKQEVRVHVLPFMRLSASDASLEKHARHFNASDLFPGYFVGRHADNVVEAVQAHGRVSATQPALRGRSKG